MITVYLAEDPKWNEIVKSFQKYDVHYLQEYVKAFQITGAGEPLLFYAENHCIRGFNVVMKRDIACDEHLKGVIEKGKLFDFATPYGYGGWIFGGEGDRKCIMDEYQSWCKNNGIVSEFTRFNLYSNSREDYYGTAVKRMENIVCDLNGSFDEILQACEYKVRKNYRKAVNSGLEILIEKNINHLDEFLDIYYGTMQRDAAENSYYFKRDFFEQICTMPSGYVFFHVVLEGKIISTELVLMGTENMYSFLGGTDSEFFAYRPNDYLKCEALRWGLENGYKRFVLGGGYGSEDGIFRYKKSFAPTGIVEYYIGKAIHDEDKYNQLCKLRGNDGLNDTYFPAYRG